MPRPLNEQVVVLTGASSGVGRDAALKFGRAGASVVLAARNTIALEEVANEIRQMGGQALVVPTDVADWEQAFNTFGHIDIWGGNIMYNEAANDWEVLYCPTPWCDADRLLVKRHAEQPDAWWVTEGEDYHPWLVARKIPICPFCGEKLATSANLSVDKVATKTLPGSWVQW